jgi:DNA-binding MarR family transcriptional regulator
VTPAFELLDLLWRVDHALGKLSRQMLDRLGVTSPQRVALRVLLRAPDTTAAGVADLLKVDRSSVTGILQRMEEAGLIARTPDESDGRKQRIVVTDAGRRVDALRHGTVEAAMERTVASMEPWQIQTVTQFLLTFAVQLDRERDVLRKHEEKG